MATDVLYNGVLMHNVLTRSWNQDIVYDETDTDTIRSDFRLEFEGVIHLQAALTTSASRVFVSGSGASASDAVVLYQQIRACLHEPRKDLEVTFNGQSVLRCVYRPAGNDPDCDVNHGPRPKQVTLEHIVSDNLFRVRFVVECSKVECCTPSGPFPQGVLNNRWGVIETIDENQFVTRTIRGKIRISNSMAQNLHALKPMVVPTLEAGFRRANIEFAALPNGLEADYVVTDRQVHTAAPWPAARMRCSFEEANESNTFMYSQVSARLEGIPNADKRLLMARAVQIAEARLGDFNSMTDATTLIENIALYEEIGDENVVEFRCRLRRAPPDGSAFIGNLPAGNFGLPLQLTATPTPYDPADSQAPPLWGYNPFDSQGTPRNPAAMLYALKCYLQTPCDANHGILQVSNLTQGSTPAGSGAVAQTAVSGTQVSQLTPWTPPRQVSSDAKSSIYLYSKMTSEYKVERNRVQLPIAGDVSNPSLAASAFVTLGRPQAVREIVVDGERVGSPPKMPNPLDSYQEAAGNTARLIEHHVTPFPPTISIDGVKKIYRARGYYKYALTRAPLASEKLQAGVLPFTDFQLSDTAQATSDLYDGKLGPGPQTSQLVANGPGV